MLSYQNSRELLVNQMRHRVLARGDKKPTQFYRVKWSLQNEQFILWQE